MTVQTNIPTPPDDVTPNVEPSLVETPAVQEAAVAAPIETASVEQPVPIEEQPAVPMTPEPASEPVVQQPVEQPAPAQMPATEMPAPQPTQQPIPQQVATQPYQQPQPAAQQPTPQPQPVYTQPQPQAVYTQPQQVQQQQQAYIPPQQQPVQQPYQQPVPQQQFQPQPGAAVPPASAYAATPPKKTNGKAIAALICGILAILNSPTVILGIILGIVAIVLGFMARKEAKSGMATGGLICGIVGAVLSVVMIIVIAFAVGSLSQADDPEQMTEDFLDQFGLGHNIVETTPGYLVTDDAVCTIKLTKVDMDSEGNLNIYFDLTDNTVTEVTVSTDSLHPWTVNDTKVDAVAFSWADPNETVKDQCITIPSNYMPVKRLEDVKSVKGVLTVTLEISGNEMYYSVVL